MPTNTWAALEEGSRSLKGVVDVLIFIAKFLFLTPWGWILIGVALVSMVVVRIRNRKDEVTFYSAIGGITETLFWLYTNMTSILIGVFVVLVLSLLLSGFQEFSDSLRLFKEVKTLSTTLKNLKAERKVLELKVSSARSNGTNRMNVNVKYFAYSPVKDADIATGEKVFTVEGEKLYVDFGVINFAYAQIENGEAVNIAFPHRLYSETVAYDSGADIFASAQAMPLSFQLSDEDIYVQSRADYETEMKKIFAAATNATQARRLGVRTAYGQSVAFTPTSDAEKVYRIYTTGTGGVVLK